MAFPITEAAFGGVLRKRCSENMQQIYRRTLMQKFDFNKVVKQLNWNDISASVFSCIIYCIFSKHLFLRTPVDECFWEGFDNTSDYGQPLMQWFCKVVLNKHFMDRFFMLQFMLFLVKLLHDLPHKSLDESHDKKVFLYTGFLWFIQLSIFTLFER